MSNTQPYPNYRPGDGTRYPVQRAPERAYYGEIDHGTERRLWNKHNQSQDWDWKIAPVKGFQRVEPSQFMQFGQGRGSGPVHFDTTRGSGTMRYTGDQYAKWLREQNGGGRLTSNMLNAANRKAGLVRSETRGKAKTGGRRRRRR
jgi:hypothetical protein